MGRIDDVSVNSFESFEGAKLIGAHHARKSHDIGGQNSRKLTLDLSLVHEALSAREIRLLDLYFNTSAAPWRQTDSA